MTLINTDYIYQLSIRFFVRKIYDITISDKSISKFSLENSNLISVSKYIKSTLKASGKIKKANIEKTLSVYFSPLNRLKRTFRRNN